LFFILATVAYAINTTTPPTGGSGSDEETHASAGGPIARYSEQPNLAQPEQVEILSPSTPQSPGAQENHGFSTSPSMENPGLATSPSLEMARHQEAAQSLNGHDDSSPTARGSQQAQQQEADGGGQPTAEEDEER